MNARLGYKVCLIFSAFKLCDSKGTGREGMVRHVVANSHTSYCNYNWWYRMDVSDQLTKN